MEVRSESKNAFCQAWFFHDFEGSPHGAAIVIFYAYLDTQEPRFNYSIQLTQGSQGIIN